MSIREFEPLSIIGRGAFGEVRICRQKENGDIVAIKKMRKEDMLNKNQLMHVRTEKEILKNDNPWIVKLKYSFQDDYFLYLVMDFLPGGDLMNLLMKKDILTEEEARFYTAEMILAVESVHKLHCIHRDLKPDNILIDKRGHIQLSDFGLSKLSDKTFFPLSTKGNLLNNENLNEQKIQYHNIENNNNTNNNNTNDNNTNDNNINIINNNSNLKNERKKKNRLLAYSTVGTPDYIAPEVFGQEGYGEEVDWWSIGVMFFEMIVGYPPFFSENPSDTCKKIIKWKQYFQIPNDVSLSYEAKNLIKKLVTSHENRLGVNGVDEIKKHPFFRGVDWDNIRNTKAPFIPDIKNDWDNKYFDHFPEKEPFYPPEKKNKKRKDINYSGYTFNRDFDNMKDGFGQALEVLEVMKKTIEEKKEKEIIDDLKDNNIENEIININFNNEKLKEYIHIDNGEKDVNENKKNNDNKDSNNNHNFDNKKIEIKIEDNINNIYNENNQINNNNINTTNNLHNIQNNNNEKKTEKEIEINENKDIKNKKNNLEQKEIVNNENKNNINIEINTHYISNTDIEKKVNSNNNIKINHQNIITQPLINRINFNGVLKNNTLHKKISKSPELKNIKEELTTIKIKQSKDIIVNKISPGKTPKEKTPLFAKLKLNIDTNLLNKKPIKQHISINHCKTIENKFITPKQFLDIKKK